MIKRILRKVLPNARKVAQLGSLGTDSTIGYPRLLEGQRNIVIGARCDIRDGAWLAAYPDLFPELDPRAPRLIIEDDVYIGFYACITSIHLVKICEGTLISDSLYISDHTHGHDPRKGSPRYQEIYSKGPVTIGRNCFLGYRVSVMPGVTIGDHCVVGAHSVVTRSFPAFSMIAGVPARLISKFDFNEGRWRRESTGL